MENKQITLEEIYNRLILLEKALRSKGIVLEEDNNQYKLDNEGELKDEVKVELEKRRKSTKYIPHEEVKKRLLSRG
ncbi:MAG: hypothetical protein AAB648_01915 [Patescibacteria group bacterium]